jgi:hypothetical protein
VLAAGLAWAAAIGAAPSRITATAPAETMVPKLAVAADCRTAAGRSRSRQLPFGPAPTVSGPSASIPAAAGTRVTAR